RMAATFGAHNMHKHDLATKPHLMKQIRSGFDIRTQSKFLIIKHRQLSTHPSNYVENTAIRTSIIISHNLEQICATID
ncbi:13 kda membrane protein subunit, partial [Cryptosporidium parvum Iowa II]